MLSFVSICAGDEWNLSDGKKASITSVVFAGELIGAYFWGPFADIFGRRKSFIFACVFITSAGFLSAVAPNFEILAFLRFVVGFGVGGLAVPFDLLAEFMPLSHRGTFLLYIELYWTVGSLFVGGIAWASLESQGWRFLAYMTAVPVVLSLLTTLYFLPESPRWLLEQGKVAEAEQVIRLAARRNNQTLEPFRLKEVSEKDKVKVTYFELVREGRYRISLPLWITWMAFGFTYYGVILFVTRVFTTSSSSSSSCSFDYEAIFINAVSEVVGVAVAALVIDRIGRTRSQAILYLVSGVSVACMGLRLSAAEMIFVSTLARLSVFSASSVTWVATSELYSTNIRGTGHSVCSAMARIGALFSPYLVESSLSNSFVGGQLFLINIVAAVSSSLLPETKGEMAIFNCFILASLTVLLCGVPPHQDRILLFRYQ